MTEIKCEGRLGFAVRKATLSHTVIVTQTLSSKKKIEHQLHIPNALFKDKVWFESLDWTLDSKNEKKEFFYLVCRDYVISIVAFPGTQPKIIMQKQYKGSEDIITGRKTTITRTSIMLTLQGAAFLQVSSNAVQRAAQDTKNYLFWATISYKFEQAFQKASMGEKMDYIHQLFEFKYNKENRENIPLEFAKLVLCETILLRSGYDWFFNILMYDIYRWGALTFNIQKRPKGATRGQDKITRKTGLELEFAEGFFEWIKETEAEVKAQSSKEQQLQEPAQDNVEAEANENSQETANENNTPPMPPQQQQQQSTDDDNDNPRIVGNQFYGVEIEDYLTDNASSDEEEISESSKNKLRMATEQEILESEEGQNAQALLSVDALTDFKMRVYLKKKLRKRQKKLQLENRQLDDPINLTQSSTIIRPPSQASTSSSRLVIVEDEEEEEENIRSQLSPTPPPSEEEEESFPPNQQANPMIYPSEDNSNISTPRTQQVERIIQDATSMLQDARQYRFRHWLRQKRCREEDSERESVLKRHCKGLNHCITIALTAIAELGNKIDWLCNDIYTAKSRVSHPSHQPQSPKASQRNPGEDEDEDDVEMLHSQVQSIQRKIQKLKAKKSQK